MSARCDLLCLDLAHAERLRQERPAASAVAAAAARAKALSDPTRLVIAAALGAANELCVCDLSWIAEKPQNLVSHHLRALRAAGIVESRRDGRMVMYAVTAEGQRLLTAMLGEAVTA